MINRLEFYLNIVENSINDLKRYKEKISPLIPINHNTYEDLLKYNKEIIDAIAFRFLKVQSLLGEKVFKNFLYKLGYNLDISFLEALSELEKLEILNRKEWIKLREIRNKISHEYPNEIDEVIDNLNLMIENIDYLENIYLKIKDKIETLKE